MLGDLEIEHLAVMRKLKRANCRQVMAELSKKRNLAYTTISTTLERLYKKGYLEREIQSKRGGKNYVYVFKDTTKRFAKSLFDEFVYIFGRDAINAFFSEARKR